MPRNAPANSCVTCRQRKVKCDGLQPVCHNCTKSGRACIGGSYGIKFVMHTPTPASDSAGLLAETSPVSSKSIIPNTTRSSLLKSFIPLNSDDRFVTSQNSWSDDIIASSPRTALRSLPIATAFRHYIDFLAPWYDLCDGDGIFGKIVPARALENSVLFKALVAFSAYHKYRTSGELEGVGVAFHAACVRDLLQVTDHLDASFRGDYLAATCLLRSYEILIGDSRSEQRHLLGAYLFSTDEAINMNERGFAQCGAWNYLREEITVALECRRPTRIGFSLEHEPAEHDSETMPANKISYILATIINYCFRQTPPGEMPSKNQLSWQSLRTELTTWREQLPPVFDPFSTSNKPGNPFASLWLLQPWHVAAQQYYSVAEILLATQKPGLGIDRDVILYHALRVCGLAYTNENVAARVNAFGPLSFCGRFLTETSHRRGLRSLLVEMSLPTAWPVQPIIADLEDYWASSSLI
ncbi:hypothetical protein BJ875DRAFT_162264 [Amylocarpus encephaloides]|uniref:Zn(2)-C6 fungal-type domain-containing protein n=1 Tax=Amylocarpus encephaloides TaxID=45428 RepID=A0A9P8C2S4_9HELO|nr:hypothetical protein BJ875DRAFT_162264 [Amylocarpus encephaloides]